MKEETGEQISSGQKIKIDGDFMVDKVERIYTVPLGKAYETIRTKRAIRAVNILRGFVSRHMKTEEVVISNALNAFIWQHSIEKPPRRVKVRAVKDEKKVKVYLQDEKVEEAKPEQKKEVQKLKEKKEQKPEQVERKEETSAKEKKIEVKNTAVDKK